MKLKDIKKNTNLQILAVLVLAIIFGTFLIMKGNSNTTTYNSDSINQSNNISTTTLNKQNEIALSGNDNSITSVEDYNKKLYDGLSQGDVSGNDCLNAWNIFSNKHSSDNDYSYVYDYNKKRCFLLYESDIVGENADNKTDDKEDTITDLITNQEIFHLELTENLGGKCIDGITRPNDNNTLMSFMDYQNTPCQKRESFQVDGFYLRALIRDYFGGFWFFQQGNKNVLPPDYVLSYRSSYFRDNIK
ncbi:MAG: hypothetical protein WCO35_02405 [Candidatus Nomurabacteria bacterium]